MHCDLFLLEEFTEPKVDILTKLTNVPWGILLPLLCTLNGWDSYNNFIQSLSCNVYVRKDLSISKALGSASFCRVCWIALCL